MVSPSPVSSDRSPPPQLRIEAAVREGWRAFTRTPWMFIAFTRWDAAAGWRLFRSLWLLVFVLLIVLAAGGLAVLLGRISEILLILPVLVGFALVLYLTVSQKFLAQIALLEGPGAVVSLRRGRELVDPRWVQVLLLMVVELLILLPGLRACFVGLVVATPVVACVSMAAYRQLFGTVDATGLLATEGA